MAWHTIHYACKRTDNIDLIKHLVKLGADINRVNTFGGRTPLHVAAWEGKLDTTEYLISQGAEIEKLSTCGETPLHGAATRRKVHNTVGTLAFGLGDGNFYQIREKSLHVSSEQDEMEARKCAITTKCC